MPRILALLALSLTAAPALADMPDAPWTMDQLKTVYPDLTAEQFLRIDTNADGAVDQAELDAAVADGIVPAMEG